jgi:hypothetical protein
MGPVPEPTAAEIRDSVNEIRDQQKHGQQHDLGDLKRVGGDLAEGCLGGSGEGQKQRGDPKKRGRLPDGMTRTQDDSESKRPKGQGQDGRQEDGGRGAGGQADEPLYAAAGQHADRA